MIVEGYLERCVPCIWMSLHSKRKLRPLVWKRLIGFVYGGFLFQEAPSLRAEIMMSSIFLSSQHLPLTASTVDYYKAQAAAFSPTTQTPTSLTPPVYPNCTPIAAWQMQAGCSLVSQQPSDSAHS